MKIKRWLSIASMLLFTGVVSCTWEQMAPKIDCSTDPVQIELIESTDAECGASNGSFSVNATGGEAPYEFSSEAGTNTNGVFTGISAGSYAVIVTDAKGCSVELNVTIKNLSGVNLGEIVVNDSGCDTANGAIHVSVSGGAEPYSFSINGNPTQSSNVFTGLAPGDYDVSVKDQTGCEITQSVKVQSGVSFENSIKGIIENSCAVSGCHNGSVSPDLRSFSNIQSRANSIKSRTANGSMPRGSTLSQEQIDMIACWVDDGAKDN
ncbi:hypothetical protein [Fulvivirga lutimaris]|uniref:hypothetical protein n=1 Tax=Fulvivirga lutimaris TaxID=1819566 RepID=UPI0012BBD833|nr:hypothetical protein [Fulvivirga lutimaris]MTI39070.1 hypothetical protein [Fulvivirga lutimaris]